MKKLRLILGTIAISILTVFLLTSVSEAKIRVRITSKYKLTLDNYILNVFPETKVRTFRSNFTQRMGFKDAKITVRRDGVDLGDDDIIVTGDTTKIDSETYTIIVYSDINCDGKYSYKDVMLMNSYVNGGGATGGTYDFSVTGTGYVGVFYCRR